MNGLKKGGFFVLAIMFFGVLLLPYALAGDSITIIGRVNDDYQIVTESNDAYEIGETDQGEEVVEMVGQKVKATGNIENDGDNKVIMIRSFEKLDE